MKKIKITLHKDGTQTIEVLGSKGSECVEFTKQLEERLGDKVGERVFKPEFHLEDWITSKKKSERKRITKQAK
jgi:methylaspartate ammonia-lyase